MSLVRDRGLCLDCSGFRGLRSEVVEGVEKFYCAACGRWVKDKELPVYPQSDQEKARLKEAATKVDPVFVRDWASAVHAAIEKAK